MFPGLRLKLSGLNPSLRYILLLDIIPVDNSRYRFQGGGWQAVGRAEARLPDRVFIHPDSPATGSHWQTRTISFHYAKLTNNTLDSQGHVSKHTPASTISYLNASLWVVSKRLFFFGGGFSRSSYIRSIATNPECTWLKPEMSCTGEEGSTPLYFPRPSLSQSPPTKTTRYHGFVNPFCVLIWSSWLRHTFLL